MQAISYTVERAREISGLSKTSIYALIKEGALKSNKIGKRRLINAQSLHALVTGDEE